MVKSLPEVARPLLEPHLAAMEARLRPGATVLTWASMNIDGYLHFAHAVRLLTSYFYLPYQRVAHYQKAPEQHIQAKVTKLMQEICGAHKCACSCWGPVRSCCHSCLQNFAIKR